MKHLLLTALLLSSISAGAITLEECQKLAQNNYPLTRRYGLIEKTSEYTVSNIAKGWLPQISFLAQATYQSEVVELPDQFNSMLNPEGLHKDQYKVGLNIEQVVWDGGVMSAKKKTAKSQTESEKAQIDVEMYKLNQRINELYFGVLLTDEKITLNEDFQKLLESSYNEMEKRANSGTATKANAKTIKAELLKAQQDEITLKSNRESVIQLLTAFTGKDMSNESFEKPAAEEPDYLQNNRPELKMYDAQINTVKTEEKALTSSLMPKLSIFAQGYYGYPGLNMYDDIMKYQWSLYGLVGARLTWNISGLYTNKTDKRKLETRKQSIENAKEVFTFNNNLENTQVHNAIQKYKEIMKQDDEIIQLRTEIREAEEAKLKGGVADVNDLLEEITKENQAKINRYSHEIELLKQIYELKNSVNL